MIQCQVCGASFGQLSTAHVKGHGFDSLRAYKEHFPGALVMDPAVAASIAEKRKGQRPSEETRAKLREARKGKTPAKGMVWTEEGRQRMSEACKQVVKTPEWNQRNSEAQRGRTASDETKLKMSSAAQERIAREGNPMHRPGVAFKHAAIMMTDGYKRSHAEGQAKSYACNHFNGLNDRVAIALTALGVPFIAEFIFPTDIPFRYDFCFAESKVLLEVQGCRWHFCPICNISKGLTEKDRAKRMRLDKAKATYAARQGWTLLCVAEHDLLGTENMYYDSKIRISEGNKHMVEFLKSSVLPKLTVL